MRQGTVPFAVACCASGSTARGHGSEPKRRATHPATHLLLLGQLGGRCQRPDGGTLQHVVKHGCAWKRVTEEGYVSKGKGCVSNGAGGRAVRRPPERSGAWRS